MLRFRKYLALVAVLVGAAVWGAPTQAHAAFRLRAESGTTGPGVVLTADGTSGLITSPSFSSYSTVSGQYITFSGALGQFSINATTGVSTPLLVAPGYYDAIDLNDITINSGGPASSD
ncbi:MAG TPA: hypothetical protein VEL76_00595 [Gemmataceae bacterium]|nr:hypothetical protein [Gemmataceae bacterium]